MQSHVEPSEFTFMFLSGPWPCGEAVPVTHMVPQQAV